MSQFSGARIVKVHTRNQRLEHIGEHLRIRTRCKSPFLRTPQLRGGHHFHGAGNLPRVDHAANATPDVENVGHGKALLAVSSWLSQTYFAATALRSATKVSFACVITLFISAFNPSSRTFLSMIARKSPGFEEST